MLSLKDLLAQKAESLAKMDEEIEAARLSELPGALKQALELISVFGFTSSDLFPTESPKGPESPADYKRPVAKVKAKYRDPVTGKEWTGRGRQPRWISMTGKDKSEFLIEKITSVEKELPIQS